MILCMEKLEGFLFKLMQVFAEKYWLKLTRMEEHRLPLRAYKMLLNLDQRGKN